MIRNLDDFLQHDEERSLLIELDKPEMVYKPLELICRIYVQDSLTYPRQAAYWLEYAHDIATKIYDECTDKAQIKQTKALTNLKRV